MSKYFSLILFTIIILSFSLIGCDTSKTNSSDDTTGSTTTINSSTTTNATTTSLNSSTTINTTSTTISSSGGSVPSSWNGSYSKDGVKIIEVKDGKIYNANGTEIFPANLAETCTITYSERDCNAVLKSDNSTKAAWYVMNANYNQITYSSYTDEVYLQQYSIME